MERRNFIDLALVWLIAFAANASACPDVDGLVDINCDGYVKVLAFGDSITYGRGDEQHLGGYVGRLKTTFPNVHFYNLGRPGEDTYSGRSRAASLYAVHTDMDYSVVLEGTNDFWLPNRSSGTSKLNLLSMVRSAANTGSVTLLANLTDIRRSSQRPWVISLNSQLNPYRQIDFFSLGRGIISSDSLHPSGTGYQLMAQMAASILHNYSEASRPADTDHDGVYDWEETRAGSNPNLADSDGDGLTDADELYVYHCSPTSTDTDADGFGDYQEAVVMHSNPANPLPGPPVMKTLEVLPPA